MFAYRIFTTVLFCFSLVAYADDSVETADEQTLLFSEIPSVFTASRREQAITKAPASVDIINSEQIKRYGWRTISAVLGSLPGFITTYDRAYNHSGVRGFAPPGDYNTRILVLIDGHRVNENLQDYAGLGRDFLVDMDNVERVEVVRGPASALYGSSAFFAVVNVITQRGRDLQGVRVSANTGSYSSHQGEISHGRKFTNGLETFLSASYFHSDGHENLDFPGLGTAHNLDGEEVERLHGKISWEDFTFSGSWVGRKKYLPTGTTGTTFGEPTTNYHDRRAYADLNYHHNFTGDWDMTARAFWDGYEFDDDLPYKNSKKQTITNKDVWHGQWFGGEFLLGHTFFNDHRLTIGSELRHNFQQFMANSDVNPYVQYANNNATSSIVGIYAQDEWSILDNLSLQAGGRYDHYNNFGGTFNPRLGLIYEPFDGTTLKLLYGTAFRAPNAFESIYTCCENSTPWKGNSKLKPEEIETYEIVWEQRLNNYFDLRVNPYFNNLTNLINLTVATNGIRQFQNQGNAESYGLETELKGHYENFEGRISHTYQQSKIDGYNAAPNAPQNMIKLNLSAPLWRDKLFAGLEVQYVSSRATTVGSRVPNYSITNLTLLSKRLLSGLELSGGLYNVFDERYLDPASPPLSANVVSQDGRNFRVYMNYEF